VWWRNAQFQPGSGCYGSDSDPYLKIKKKVDMVCSKIRTFLKIFIYKVIKKYGCLDYTEIFIKKSKVVNLLGLIRINSTRIRSPGFSA